MLVKAFGKFCDQYPSLHEFQSSPPRILSTKDNTSRVRIDYTCMANAKLFNEQVLPPLLKVLTEVSQSKPNTEEMVLLKMSTPSGPQSFKIAASVFKDQEYNKKGRAGPTPNCNPYRALYSDRDHFGMLAGSGDVLVLSDEENKPLFTKTKRADGFGELHYNGIVFGLGKGYDSSWEFELPNKMVPKKSCYLHVRDRARSGKCSESFSCVTKTIPCVGSIY